MVSTLQYKVHCETGVVTTFQALFEISLLQVNCELIGASGGQDTI